MEQVSSSESPPDLTQTFRYLLVIDFEATCLENNSFNFPHEIIEFPIVIFDTQKCQITATFHSFCRPIFHPTLSEFCKNLTGITQQQIDEAPTFGEVLKNAENFLTNHQIFSHSFSVVVDNHSDMDKFLARQCIISKTRFPKWCSKWIDLSLYYRFHFKLKHRTSFSLMEMLSTIDVTFAGRHHSGLDDARNILSLAQYFIEKRIDLQHNGSIHRSARQMASFRASIRHSNSGTTEHRNLSVDTRGDAPQQYPRNPHHHHHFYNDSMNVPQSSASPSSLSEISTAGKHKNSLTDLPEKRLTYRQIQKQLDLELLENETEESLSELNFFMRGKNAAQC